MPKIGLNLLSDVAVKNAKYGDGKSRRDGGGLWLMVEPSGRKWWKLKTVFGKKESSFSLGDYPTVSLTNARKERDAIRARMALGVNPSVTRKEEKARATGDGSFEEVARDWYARFMDSWSKGYATDVLVGLEKDVFPYVGRRQIGEITAQELLAVLDRIRARTLETAHRIKTICGQIFRYAIRIGLCNYNPVEFLQGALPPRRPKHMAATTDPKALAPLLRMLDGYEGSFVVACALRLAPLVFVRPGELRQAEWEAIDLEEAEWKFLASKTGQEHVVPLSRQAVAILHEIHALTGAGRYVFPSGRSPSRPMSNATINAAMRRMGIDTQNEMTGHGFRAVARTLLDEELGYRPDLIEHQLAHAVKDPLGRAYNRTKHLPERKKMMQDWADYLDAIKKGAKILPLRESAK